MKQTNRIIILIIITLTLISCNSAYKENAKYVWDGTLNGWILTEYNLNGLKDVVIPQNIIGDDWNNVVGIGPNVFKDTNIESIVFPNTIKYIGSKAFENTANLKGSLAFSTSLLKIEKRAFYNTNLNYIFIPDTVEYIGKLAFNKINVDYSNMSLAIISYDNDQFKGAKRNAINWAHDFRGNYSIYGYGANKNIIINCVTSELPSLNIPNTRDGVKVTKIENDAFRRNGNIKDFNKTQSLTLGKYIETIGNNAFRGINLKNIEFNDKLKSIGNFAFSKSYLDDEGKFKFIVPKEPTVINKMPAGLESIGSSAFVGANIDVGDTLNLPSIKTLGRSAFAWGTHSFKTVNIGKDINSMVGLAFSSNTQLETVNFENNSKLEVLGKFSFYNCTNLTNVNLPDSLETIGKRTFDNCTSLEKIELPTSLKTIGTSSFTNCDSLKEVTLNEGIETISSFAFFRTRKLKTMTFPSSLKTIEGDAFKESGFESIDLSNTQVTEITPYSFASNPQLTTLKLPEGLKILNLSAFDQSGVTNLVIPRGTEIIPKEECCSPVPGCTYKIHSSYVISTELQSWFDSRSITIERYT